MADALAQAIILCKLSSLRLSSHGGDEFTILTIEKNINNHFNSHPATRITKFSVVAQRWQIAA